MRNFYQQITTFYVNGIAICNDAAREIYVYADHQDGDAEPLQIDVSTTMEVAKQAGLKVDKKKNMINGQVVQQVEAIATFKQKLPNLNFLDLLSKMSIPAALDFLRDQLAVSAVQPQEPEIVAKENPGDPADEPKE